jgi:regulator of sirC expression with transglutaminase-like and TPR domain
MSHPEARSRLAALIEQGGEPFPLAEAALWVAADDLDGVDPAVHMARLDSLAARVRDRSPDAAPGSTERCAALTYILFHEERFVGNSTEYQDPGNSYLNVVLDRHTGLPITLSIVFIEVARRVELNAYGLNFPGHFLVAVRQPEGVVVLDPFHRGATLTADELRGRWQGTTGMTPPALAVLLAPADGPAIITRLLNNLKLLYLQRGDTRRAIATVEKTILVQPLVAEHHRDLGALYLSARSYGKAIESLERYLRLAPDAVDAGKIREHLRSATQLIARWN